MTTPRQILFEYVLTRLQSEPIHTRIALLRALADYAGCERTALELLAQADDLDQADARCRQFAFTFSQGRNPNLNPN